MFPIMCHFGACLCEFIVFRRHELGSNVHSSQASSSFEELFAGIILNIFSACS